MKKESDFDMKLKFKNLEWEFDRFDAFLAAAISLLTVPAAFLLFNEVLPVILSAGLIGGIVGATRRKYVNSLLARIKSQYDLQWEFQLNGVAVGSISDADFAAIRLKVLNDTRNYTAELMNACKVISKVIEYMYVSIPIGLFWLVVAVTILAPEVISASWNEILNLSPAMQASMLIAGIKKSVMVLAALSLYAVAINIVIGSRFGFINSFSAATATALRQHFGQTADGETKLVRWVDEDIVINNELPNLKMPLN